MTCLGRLCQGLFCVDMSVCMLYTIYMAVRVIIIIAWRMLLKDFS